MSNILGRHLRRYVGLTAQELICICQVIMHARLHMCAYGRKPDQSDHSSPKGGGDISVVVEDTMEEGLGRGLQRLRGMM